MRPIPVIRRQENGGWREERADRSAAEHAVDHSFGLRDLTDSAIAFALDGGPDMIFDASPRSTRFS